MVTIDTRLAARRTRPVSHTLREVAEAFARSQHDLVHASAALADSGEWALDGSPTAAHWIADVADVEDCTAREWIRIGRRVRGLPLIAEAFAERRISYSKVRTLTRVATPENEAELLQLALDHPAGRLTRALACWLSRNTDPEDLDTMQRRARSATWRTDPDGTVLFTLRLQPVVAAVLVALLTTLVMRRRPQREPDGAWPTLAQQHADAVAELLDEGSGRVSAEVVFHVRGDGCTTDDGTPVAESAIADLVDQATLRAMIHDADARPINASGRHRRPTDRQKRVVKERDQGCVDCGRGDLLEYDHVPTYAETGHTLIDELELRCAPCHRRRHATPMNGQPCPTSGWTEAHQR